MLKVISLFVIGLALLFACEENTSPSNSYFVSRTECKGAGYKIETDSSMECVQLTYNNGTLEINHINAGFNCCPDDFGKVKITDVNGIILIDESGVNGDCDCLCLYDVAYRIENLNAGVYEIRVIGNVGNGGGKQISGVKVDFAKESSATICEARTHYPWNI